MKEIELEKQRLERQEYFQEYRKENADKLNEYHRDWELRYKYGITREDYYKLAEKQHYLCASCGQPETAKHKKTKKPLELRVDWDKKNQKVRRLICAACQFAIKYLEKHNERIKHVLNYLDTVDSTKRPKV